MNKYSLPWRVEVEPELIAIRATDIHGTVHDVTYTEFYEADSDEYRMELDRAKMICDRINGHAELINCLNAAQQILFLNNVGNSGFHNWVCKVLEENKV